MTRRGVAVRSRGPSALGFFSMLRPLSFCCLALVLAAQPAAETVRLEPFAVVRARDGAGAGSLLLGAASAREVPRAVTVLGRDLLADYAVASLEDLTPLVPGALSVPQYGIAGVPTMRGDLGETLQNGQRRAFNRNVFPPTFNGVEAVVAMTGAAPLPVGYTAGTGGVVDLATKRPDFSRPRAVVRAALGSWSERRGQVDVNRPLSDGVALRLSVERVEADSFYRFDGRRSWSGYLALAWRRPGGARWDFNAEAYAASFLENPGTNRPTQALIDEGLYTAGSSVQNGGTGSYFGNTFAPAGLVRIDGSQILAAPGDGATARDYTAQLTGRWLDGGGREWTSRTFFEGLSALKRAAYRFYSFTPESLTVEQRLEAREERAWAGRRHGLQWGASARGERRESFVEFFNEAINAFDLTLDPDTLRLPPSQWKFVLPVPGRPGEFAQSGGRYGSPLSVGASQTLRSRLGSAGVFVQDRVELRPGWTLVAGGRLDLLSVRSEDPLPQPGFAAVRDGLTRWLPAGTASLVWNGARGLDLYATWQDVAAVESSGSTGGFGLTANRLPRELFANRNRLLELGVKAGVPEAAWSGALAVFQQRRSRTNARSGLPDDLLLRGVEAQGAWRISPAFDLSANAAYHDARYVDGPPPGNIATVPAFDPSRPSDNFGAYPRGDYRLPGVPRWTANLAFAVRPAGPFSGRVWSAWQGGQNLDLFGRVKLRAQHTWNAAVWWRRGAWECRVAGLNLTDEFNWRPTSTPFAGADLVTREPPRRWQASVARWF